MRITASTLSLASEHAAATQRRTSETLRTWRGPTRPDFEGTRTAAAGPPPLSAAVAQISAAARALAAAVPPTPSASAESKAIDAASDAVENDPVLQLLKSLVERLTGQPVKVFSAKQFSRDIEARAVDVAKATAPLDPNRPVGWGIEYDAHTVTTETEATHVTANGTVRTADGQSIAFVLDIKLQRSHREETSVTIRAGDAVRRDPLVINFSGAATQLSDQKFSFDLLGTGGNNLLPLFASGSGYLALDVNQNGVIDTGRELFGPVTGSGFGELAKQDQDGNGWIDENDPAYDKLRVWTPAADGKGTLATLREAGVGAIALAHVASPFELRDGANANLGAVRASGIWLSDSGTAGGVQEIDLTI